MKIHHGVVAFSATCPCVRIMQMSCRYNEKCADRFHIINKEIVIDTYLSHECLIYFHLSPFVCCFT